MKIVYLDQNKWIELGQVESGKTESEEAQNALTFLRGAKEMRQVCIPLSLVHYMETLKRTDDASRDRLGEFMWDLSGGMSIARGPALLQHELDRALHDRLPQRVDSSDVRPLDLLGKGMGHAQGEPIQRFVVPEEAVVLLGLGQSDAFERQINDLIERSLLGAGPFAAVSGVPRPDLADVEDFFAANLVAVRSWLANLPSAMLEDGVYLMSLTDILVALREALARHRIPVSALSSLGWNDVRTFIDDLSTQRVATHLLREWARNKSLRLKRNDLYDWMGLVPAIAYCDVVVCEKLVADLANRGNLRKKAVVITKLGDLPGLLTELSR